MPRSLSYADAARLLGGKESATVTTLDAVTGGALLGAAVAIPAVLSLFDAKAEFIRLSHDLVGKLTERRHGLSRHGRTERLAAAHRIIVVTAFFEAVEAADLPFRFRELELTKREQVAIGGAHGPEHQPLLRSFFAADAAVPLPGPQQPYERFREILADYYQQTSARFGRFVVGLAAWDMLGRAEQDRFQDILRQLPDRAVERHQELLGRLAADFPEVAFWAALREHEGTRADVRASRDEVRQLAAAFTGLERLLRDISTGRAPDERRASPARAYAATLDRPIITSGEVPAGLRVPTLGEAYAPPLCRIVELGAGDRPSDESWWADQPVRDDLPEFLSGYLTTPAATSAPLLVLGQPGSGKSVFTRILAARLPAADFLPVRVVLRDVPAAADLQDQIEYAIRDATGERLDWPTLARSAGDALPVVLLDGFDELLQATGVSQTDYLTRVAAFQRREADQGRPVVVVVTSRTSVADRAQPPEGTVALRLEPFDEQRIADWLATWNAVNTDHFARRGLAPLDLPTVLAHRQLAEQPLLLLMLALYDADGNALRSAGNLRQDELYERLLRRFARREVTKHRHGLPDREVERAVEEELRRLSVVAFAMFNRAAQWVTEAQLDEDLTALFGPSAVADPVAGLRAPLRHAEITLGRFFFVHRARASRDDSRLETYEFLHATFGEYLVARFTWQVLRDVAAREAAATLSLGGGTVDDDLLYALLSYAVVSGRAPIVGFLQALMSGVDDGRRADLTDLLVRLFGAAHHSRPPRRFDHYQPRGLPVPARHANYSANLMLLAVCAAGSLRGSTLYPGRNAVACWHRETLLWQSQLTGPDWESLVNILALDRLWTGDQDDRRDIALSISADPDEVAVSPVDLAWTHDIRKRRVSDEEFGWLGFPQQSFTRLARAAHLRCAIDDDALVHAVAPLTRVSPGPAFSYGILSSSGGARSLAYEIATFLASALLPLPARERQELYDRVTLILDASFANPEVEHRFAAVVLDRLADDLEMPVDLVIRAIDGLRVIAPDEALRCGLAHLGRDEVLDVSLGHALAGTLRIGYPARYDSRLRAEVVVRLAKPGGFLTRDFPFSLDELAKILDPFPELRERFERAQRDRADVESR